MILYNMGKGYNLIFLYMVYKPGNEVLSFQKVS